MKKHQLFLGLLFMLTFSLASSGCFKDFISGSGSVRTEERLISGRFNRIRVKGSMDVLIKQGDSIKVTVKDFENILPYITTKLSGNVLIIDFDDAWIRNSVAEIGLTLPQLNGIDISGSSNVSTLNNFVFDDLDVDINGSGNLNLVGSAKTVTTLISGSGDVRALDLPCDTAIVKISGSGDLRLLVNKLLNVNISGSGDVLYKGNATVESRISGSGQIRKI